MTARWVLWSARAAFGTLHDHCPALSIGASLGFVVAPDFVYRTQSKWFSIPRATFNVIIYSFLGAFKIVFLVFNVVPYMALLIVG